MGPVVKMVKGNRNHATFVIRLLAPLLSSVKTTP